MVRKRLYFNNKDWNKIFELSFKTTEESKIQWLRFKNFHKIIPKKIKESSVCSFCKRVNDTIEHFIVDCFYVKEL